MSTPTETTTVHYRNGKIFTAAGQSWAQSIVVDGNRIRYVGNTTTAERLSSGARTVDLGGALVLPGFIDAHTHLLSLGQSLRQVDLRAAINLADIQDRVRAQAQSNPDSPRILGRGWLYAPLNGHPPDRYLLDSAESQRPVYLSSNDSHTAWLNTAAIRELGIDASTPDPIGGRIERDLATGEPTGMLYESAALQLMRGYLAQRDSDEHRDTSLAAAFDHYLSDGVTGVVDMGLDADDLAALERALRKGDGTLPVRVAGHWLINKMSSLDDHLEQVAEAARLHQMYDSEWLRITGIKILVDGVIDSCTAAMNHPFADGSHPGPIWDFDSLAPVVAAADAAGLQIAMHAIGDAASEIALNALEHAATANGDLDRRHRLEHLETITDANVQRLARLGVIASMQPVHADPAIQANWRSVLGDERIDRAYPWPEFVSAGAVLAFGSDAPTAPHQPLPNMYVATTRKSATDPALPPNIASYAMPLPHVLTHATADAAYSCRWENLTGRLAAGLAADFIVLEDDPFTDGNDALLTAKISSVVVGGQIRRPEETPRQDKS